MDVAAPEDQSPTNNNTQPGHTHTVVIPEPPEHWDVMCCWDMDGFLHLAVVSGDLDPLVGCNAADDVALESGSHRDTASLIARNGKRSSKQRHHRSLITNDFKLSRVMLCLACPSPELTSEYGHCYRLQCSSTNQQPTHCITNTITNTYKQLQTHLCDS
jgi:hypothetical protein